MVRLVMMLAGVLALPAAPLLARGMGEPVGEPGPVIAAPPPDPPAAAAPAEPVSTPADAAPILAAAPRGFVPGQTCRLIDATLTMVCD